jgi:diguanylate cyclase
MDKLLLDRSIRRQIVESVIITVILLVLAYLAKIYPIEIFYGASLSFATALILILRPIHGPKRSSLLVGLVFIVLTIIEGYDSAVVIWILQILFVYQLTRFKRLKNSYVILVLLYWGIIVPIMAIFNWFELGILFEDNAYILYIVLSMGELFNALVAELFIVYSQRLSKRVTNFYRLHLMELLYHFLLVSTLMPLILFTLLSMRHFEKDLADEVYADLAERVTLFELELELLDTDKLNRIILGEKRSLEDFSQFILTKQSDNYVYSVQLNDGQIIPQRLLEDADARYVVQTIYEDYYFIYEEPKERHFDPYLRAKKGAYVVTKDLEIGRLIMSKNSLGDRTSLFRIQYRYMPILAMGLLGGLALLFFAIKIINDSYEHVLNLTSELPAKIERNEEIIWPNTRFYEINRFVENTRIMAAEILLLFKESENLNMELEAQTEALMESEESMRQLALKDGLTELPNRYAFNQYLDVALRSDKIEARKGSLAIVYMDLDRFKQINDTFGHSVGDLLLKQVSKRILDKINKDQFDDYMVARIGGDEFVVIISYEDNDRLEQQLSRLLSHLNQVYQIETYPIHSVASLGVALCPFHGCDKDTLLKKADAAMYHAKISGGNCYFLYEEYMLMDAH